MEYKHVKERKEISVTRSVFIDISGMIQYIGPTTR